MHEFNFIITKPLILILLIYSISNWKKKKKSSLGPILLGYDAKNMIKGVFSILAL